MHAKSKWNRVPGRCTLALGLGALAMAAVPALACTWYNPAMPRAQAVLLMQQEAQLMHAVYRAGGGAFMTVGHESSSATGDIVGLWKISMVSDGVAPNPVPAGALVDFGTVQWH